MKLVLPRYVKSVKNQSINLAVYSQSTDKESAKIHRIFAKAYSSPIFDKKPNGNLTTSTHIK